VSSSPPPRLRMATMSARTHRGSRRQTPLVRHLYAYISSIVSRSTAANSAFVQCKPTQLTRWRDRKLAGPIAVWSLGACQSRRAGLGRAPGFAKVRAYPEGAGSRVWDAGALLAYCLVMADATLDSRRGPAQSPWRSADSRRMRCGCWGRGRVRPGVSMSCCRSIAGFTLWERREEKLSDCSPDHSRYVAVVLPSAY